MTLFVPLNGILNDLPALTASVPSGRHISPERRKMKTEFSGSVWKYSPSSTYKQNQSHVTMKDQK